WGKGRTTKNPCTSHLFMPDLSIAVIIITVPTDKQTTRRCNPNGVFHDYITEERMIAEQSVSVKCKRTQKKQRYGDLNEIIIIQRPQKLSVIITLISISSKYEQPQPFPLHWNGTVLKS
ncbi:unnamed protein product, partial [Allacma fusca]